LILFRDRQLLFGPIFGNSSLGDLSGGGTPGPIPNPEVKPVSADGTWRAASWESRSSPRGFTESPIGRLSKRPLGGVLIPSVAERVLIFKLQGYNEVQSNRFLQYH
jgi:hypothetical protein